MRVLLNPAATDGGAQPTPITTAPPFLPGFQTAPEPPTPEPPKPEPVKPPDVRTIPVPEDMVKRFYQMERELDQQRQEAAKLTEEKEQSRLLEAAKRGEVEQSFQKYKEQHEAKFQNLHRAFVERERDLRITEALTDLGAKFVSNVHAQHAIRLLKEQVVGESDAAGNIVVRDKTSSLPVRDAVASWLEGEGSIYVAPKGQTGAGAGGSQPAPGPAQTPANPLAVPLMQWAAAKAGGGFGLRPTGK